MSDDPSAEAQDPEGPPDQRPVGPMNPRVRVITIVLGVAVVMALGWVLVAMTVMR